MRFLGVLRVRVEQLKSCEVSTQDQSRNPRKSTKSSEATQHPQPRQCHLQSLTGEECGRGRGGLKSRYCKWQQPDSEPAITTELTEQIQGFRVRIHTTIYISLHHQWLRRAPSVGAGRPPWPPDPSLAPGARANHPTLSMPRSGGDFGVKAQMPAPYSYRTARRNKPRPPYPIPASLPRLRMSRAAKLDQPGVVPDSGLSFWYFLFGQQAAGERQR